VALWGGDFFSVAFLPRSLRSVLYLWAVDTRMVPGPAGNSPFQRRFQGVCGTRGAGSPPDCLQACRSNSRTLVSLDSTLKRHARMSTAHRYRTDLWGEGYRECVFAYTYG